jgi:hypothetical protein
MVIHSFRTVEGTGYLLLVMAEKGITINITITININNGPFDPFRLQSYSFSRQRFFGLPIVLLPCCL